MIRSEALPLLEYDYQFNFMFNDVCNMQCPYCMAKRFESDEDLKHNKHYYEKLLEVLSFCEDNSNVFSFSMGGEPLISYKKFLSFIEDYLKIAKKKNINVTIETPTSLSLKNSDFESFLIGIHNLQNSVKPNINFRYKILASYHYLSPIKDLTNFIKNVLSAKKFGYLNTINVLLDPHYLKEIEHDFNLIKKITNHSRIYYVPIILEKEDGKDLHYGEKFERYLENRMFKLKQTYSDGSEEVRQKDIIYKNEFNAFKGWNCDLKNYCVINVDGNAYHCSAGLNHFDGIYDKPFHNILVDDNSKFWEKTKVRKCKWDHCTCEVYRTKWLDAE